MPWPESKANYSDSLWITGEHSEIKAEKKSKNNWSEKPNMKSFLNDKQKIRELKVFETEDQTKKYKKIKQQIRNKITPGIGLPKMSDFRLSIDV